MCLFQNPISAIFALTLMVPLPALADDGQLVVHTGEADHPFTVEVVDTPEGRAQGLMFRAELAPDAGMLFDFHDARPVSFWMRNTLIPLDMIFIRSDGTIANIKVKAEPLDLTSVPSDGPVEFVLEIAGGRSEELGIEAGDSVEHDRIGADQEAAGG